MVIVLTVLSPLSCSLAATPSATTASGATVNQPIRLIVAPPGMPTVAKLYGCSVTPASILADGAVQTVYATAGCTITVQLPAASTVRYETFTKVGGVYRHVSRFFIVTCALQKCPAYSRVIYQEHKFTVLVVPPEHGTVVLGGSAMVTAIGIVWWFVGTRLLLQAVPSSGHHFVKWTSSTSLDRIANPTKATTTVTILATGTIAAVFS